MPENRFRYVSLRNGYLFSPIHVRDTALADGVGYGFLDVLAESFEEALPINGTFLPFLLSSIDNEECHCESLRFPYAQIPLGQEPNLLFRVAVFHQALHKIFMFLLILFGCAWIEGNDR